MTPELKIDDRPYGNALRYYSRSWRDRHGADMVAMMMDAADEGEDPLGAAARRTLMWSGLCQRFASRPLFSLSVALGVLALAAYELSATRIVQIDTYIRIYGSYDIAGFDRWIWPTAIGAGCLFLVTTLTVTVSVLHVPPLPDHPVKTARLGWLAWLAFALSASRFLPLAEIVAVLTLIAGARLYRRTRVQHYRILAGLSAAWVGAWALLLLPGTTVALMCQTGIQSVC